jgi:asparagine synthase (glutamine-hydrolysing)
MRDPATGNWIVYNGEIYNFRDIRSELQRKGQVFTSNSDTEVLLKAYGYWGGRCLDRLRGMFAFAIWDAHQRSLWIVRDPMGVKPLYYWQAGPRFLFASEVRALLATGLPQRRLDPAGLANYLTFGSACDSRTLVEGISVLPPGHCLKWRAGRLEQAMYWNLAERIQRLPQPTDRQQAEQELHGTLRDSVRMQLVSDVPVGIFLSGGIDSSSLTALLCRQGASVQTFSLSFQESDYSEAEYSRTIARKFGTDHHEIAISQRDVLIALPEVVSSMDQPSIDGVNTYLIAGAARGAGIKVALSGLGADELFAGYSSFRTVPRVERFSGLCHRFPPSARDFLGSAISFFGRANDRTRKLTALATANGNLLHPYFLSRMLFTPSQRARLYPLGDEAVQQRANAGLRQSFLETSSLDAINRVSYLESRCYMLNTLLRDADVMSMAHGLELRVPFVDHVLSERAMAVPGKWKLDRGLPKPLLVRPLQRFLPEQIIYRRKCGFTLPWERWLRDELRSEVEDTLARIADGPFRDLLNYSAVKEVWQDFIGNRTSWSRPWSLYVLQKWCEQNRLSA